MISIIIVVKNDRGVAYTLEGLKRIIIPEKEKVETIVIDASNHGMEDIKEKHPEVHWFDYNNLTGKKRTTPEQRNMGIRKASGEYIVFLDAHCIPINKWLVLLFDMSKMNNEYIVTGLVLPTKKRTLNTLGNEADKDKYKKECPTINVLIKREVFNKIGNFNESFSYGQDVDFMWRAIDAGYKIRNYPQALVYHDWGGFKDEIRRSYKYGIARTHLYLVHKNRWKQLFTYDAMSLVYPVFIILLPLTFIFPLYPFLIILLLIRNYKNKPFKLVFLHLVHGIGEIVGCFKYLLKKEKTAW